MEHLCEVQSNWQAGFKLTEVSVMEKASGGDTSAQGKPQICHRSLSVSSSIYLYISRWRIKHSAVWKSSQWEQLLEGEQHVLILRTSIWGSYNFMVILDINVSVLLFIWVSFNIKNFFISVACVGSCWNNWRFSSYFNLLFSIYHLLKHSHGRGYSEVFVWLRNWIHGGNFNLPGNFTQHRKI